MCEFRVLLALIGSVAFLSGATLERLSMDDLSTKSTDIVRAKVSGSRTALRGSVVYTFYSLQVTERWKGNQAATMEVAVPGGAMEGLHQTFSGAPALTRGSDYVLFLWTGPSGTTQIMGLSQGLFDVRRDTGGHDTAMRAASTGLMLDAATHKVVRDAPVRLDLTVLRGRVSAALGRGVSR